MKKNIFSISLITLCAASVGAQLPASRFVEIQTAYERVVSNPDDKKAQTEFFEAFPGSYLDYLINYYDHDQEAAEHELLFSKGMTHINDSLLCAKAINVSIGAVEGIDYQGALKTYMLKPLMYRYPDRMLQLISSMTEGDQALYWQYFWGTPFYKERMAEKMEQLRDYMLEKGYSEEAAIMENAFRGFHGKTVWSEDPFDTEHINQRQFQGQDW